MTDALGALPHLPYDDGDDDGDRRPAPPRPALALVRGAVGGDTPESEMPCIGRSAAIGYVIGFIASVVIITVAGTLAGLGLGASFGLGAFVGVWGGGGFGFMMGGTVPLARYLDAQSVRSPRPNR